MGAQGAWGSWIRHPQEFPSPAQSGNCIAPNLSENGLDKRNSGPNPVIEQRGAMHLPQQAGQLANFSPADEQSREREEESQKIRRLQLMMSMVMSVIGQDPNLTIEEASELAAGARRAALAMFPDKELAYDLLYKPRLQRLITERFRLQ